MFKFVGACIVLNLFTTMVHQIICIYFFINTISKHFYNITKSNRIMALHITSSQFFIIFVIFLKTRRFLLEYRTVKEWMNWGSSFYWLEWSLFISFKSNTLMQPLCRSGYLSPPLRWCVANFRQCWVHWVCCNVPRNGELSDGTKADCI